MADLKTYTDEQLAALVRSGDHLAFTEIYRRYWPMLLRHARRMLQDEDGAKDVLQEVFVTFWNKAAQLQFENSTLSSYLYTLTRNRVLNQMAKDKVKDTYIASLGKLEEAGDLHADRELRARELEAEMEKELILLPPKMREVFELSRKEHLSHQQIASQLDITTFTVKKQINTALHRLRTRLEPPETDLKIKKND